MSRALVSAWVGLAALALLGGCRDRQPAGPEDLLARAADFRLAQSSSRSRDSTLNVGEVTLAGDTRPSLVVDSGLNAEIDVEWARRARLRVAHAVIDPAPDRRVVRFSVVLSRGGRPEVIHAAEATVPAGQRGRWESASIDMPSGHRGTLHFAADVVEGPSGRVAWGSPRIVYPRAPGEANVIIVSLDTLRADHLGCYGYTERPTTPEIDDWAEAGVRFEWAVSQAPWTTPSHMSLLTALAPALHGVDAPIRGAPRRLPRSIPTLAEMVREKGMVTTAFTAGGPMGARFGFARGFDSYRERVPREGYDMRRGIVALERWLAAHGTQRFFVFFHTYEIHQPWTHRVFPEQGTARERARIQYDGDLRFADRMVGQLRATLTRLGLAQDTLVVIVSDHGENLYDRYVDFKPTGHGYHLYDEMLRVPLILVGPGVPRGRVVSQQVALIDVLPTVMELLGLPVETWIEGRSLVPQLMGATGRAEASRPYVIAEATAFGPPRLAVRTDRFKYVYITSLAPDPIRAMGTWTSWDDLAPRELFDLEADPGEVRNLAAEHPERVRALHKLIEEHLAQAEAFRAEHPATESSHDSELDEQLRSLGYLD